MTIEAREYGSVGPDLILLHGGPGAAGYMASLARELAAGFRVIEPFQRGSGDERLTVARHIADLHGIVVSRCASRRPSIVGHSWGAMLALAYSCAYPHEPACLALVGCGTFDSASRTRVDATRKERMGEDGARRVDQLAERYADRDQRFLAMGWMMQRIDSYDLIPTQDEIVRGDARAHEETWQDMLRLQAEGVYPATFSSIRSPTIMMHGVFDPHPGQMIHDNLKPHLPQLEYREWERCGHYPWLERAARDDFMETLTAWLKGHTASCANEQPF